MSKREKLVLIVIVAISVVLRVIASLYIGDQVVVDDLLQTIEFDHSGTPALPSVGVQF